MKKSLNPFWLVNPDIPLGLRDWIIYKGSFIERLKEYGVAEPRIQLVEQRWALRELDEKKCLAMDFRQLALVREVFITSEKKYWMFARTIFPRQTITGRERILSQLKNKSLGSVLFKNPTLQRSEFEIVRLRAGTFWHEKVSQNIKRILPDLWMRRSLFYLHEKSLLLTEIFLADMETRRCLTK